MALLSHASAQMLINFATASACERLLDAHWRQAVGWVASLSWHANV